MANFTNRSDLEKQITKRRVIELFDDDGDGLVDGEDLEALNEVLSEANDFVTNSIVFKGFDSDQLNGLSRDRSLRRSAAQIAAEISGTRRTEFLDPSTGEAPYAAMGKRGRDYIKAFSKGEERSRLEEQHGANFAVGGDNTGTNPPFIFNRDPSNPDDPYGPGGF